MALEQEIYQAIGKRKTSIANVTLVKGSGKFTINEKHFNEYFSGTSEELYQLNRPFLLTSLNNAYDTAVFVKGGGTSAQLSAITLGLSKVLCFISKDSRSILKKNGLLRRDARIKERRKYGLKKARKASQYSKR